MPYRNVNGSSGKESACQCKRHRFNPRVSKTPWSRKWQPILIFMEFSMNRRTWQATVHGVTRVGCDWATEHTQKCNRDNPCQAVLDSEASLETAPWNLQKDLGWNSSFLLNSGEKPLGMWSWRGEAPEVAGERGQERPHPPLLLPAAILTSSHVQKMLAWLNWFAFSCSFFCAKCHKKAGSNSKNTTGNSTDANKTKSCLPFLKVE